MIHRYSVTVAGRVLDVEVEDLGGGQLRTGVGGRERRLDARQVEPGVWSLLEPATGLHTTALVEGSLPALVVELGGVAVQVEVSDARRAALAGLAHRTSAADEGPARVRSPMPGRVIKLLCRVGDRVAAAQGVVVVEAMKMENELRAPRAGTVREIRCGEGAAVEAGQELVVVE